VTNNEKNKGKLYYACPYKECAMWEWCKTENASAWTSQPMNVPPIEVEKLKKY
jgi:hypothetical protein